jgi:hypothetical protein
VRTTCTSLRRPLAVHDSLSGTDSSRSSADGPSVAVTVAALVCVVVAVGGTVAVGDAGGRVADAVANADAVAVAAGGTVAVGRGAVAVAVAATAVVGVARRPSSSSPHPLEIIAARHTAPRARVTKSLDRIQPFYLAGNLE